jgi:hypothetical protein
MRHLKFYHESLFLYNIRAELNLSTWIVIKGPLLNFPSIQIFETLYWQKLTGECHELETR